MPRAALLLLLCAAVAPAPASATAAAPRVRVMIAGPAGGPQLSARTVRAAAVTVRASRKRCAVAAATPLAALVATGAALRISDYGGSCSRRAADGGALFVTGIGSARNRGRSGWAYKVGTRAGTAGAADPAGPFGRGRLRTGARLTWFWCVLSRSGSCQRTLALSAPRAVRRGRQLAVTVFGYDDSGRRSRVRGATVTVPGGVSGVSGPDGVAVVRAPARSGVVVLTARRRGLVRSFGSGLRVT